MKKLVVTVAVATMLLGAVSARAAEGMKGGLGFHAGGTPLTGVLSVFGPAGGAAPTIGARQWFNTTFGGEVAIGFNNVKIEPGGSTGSETFTGFTIDLGLPIILKQMDKVNFIVRPGFTWGSLEDKDELSVPTVTTKLTLIGVSGSLEVEYMLTDNVGISASHGIAWASLEDDATPSDKITSFATTGSNFTQLGFYVYLW